MAATSGAPTWRVSTGRTGSTLAGVIGRRRLLTGLGGVVVAGGLAAGGWKLASSGSGSTGSTSTGAVGIAAGRGTDRRVAWTYQAAGPFRSDGAISADGGTFYLGSDDGTAYALDAATGRHVEKYRVGSAVSGVMVAGGTLLVGAADGKVHAFTVGGQGFTWASPAAGAAIAGAPTTGGNVVYAGSNDHYVYALDLRTGARKWRTKTGGTPLPSQPTGTGVVWVGSQDGTMYVLSTGNGKVVGKLAVGGPVGSTPLTVTGQVYVGTGNGMLYDLFYEDFTNTTELEWNFPADGAIAGTPVPAARGDTIFAATARGTVYAVRPGSNIGNEPGTALWSRRVGGPVRSGLAVYNGVVYVGSDDGYLYAIDISTSDVLWSYKTGGAIRSRIVASNGLVYFGSLDHHVYALRA